MDDHGVPMLTDFGISRASIYSFEPFKTSRYSEPKGTFPWMAYELLEFFECSMNPKACQAKIICTKASDMWAFGMVIYVRPCFPISVFK